MSIGGFKACIYNTLLELQPSPAPFQWIELNGDWLNAWLRWANKEKPLKMALSPAPQPDLIESPVFPLIHYRKPNIFDPHLATSFRTPLDFHEQGQAMLLGLNQISKELQQEDLTNWSAINTGPNSEPLLLRYYDQPVQIRFNNGYVKGFLTEMNSGENGIEFILDLENQKSNTNSLWVELQKTDPAKTLSNPQKWYLPDFGVRLWSSNPGDFLNPYWNKFKDNLELYQKKRDSGYSSQLYVRYGKNTLGSAQTRFIEIGTLEEGSKSRLPLATHYGYDDFTVRLGSYIPLNAKIQWLPNLR